MLYDDNAKVVRRLRKECEDCAVAAHCDKRHLSLQFFPIIHSL